MKTQRPWILVLLASNLILLGVIVWVVLSTPGGASRLAADDAQPSGTAVNQAAAESTALNQPSPPPEQNGPENTALPEPTVIPTDIPETAVPQATSTTAPPEPTSTPEPTNTPIPQPTNTPTPEPTPTKPVVLQPAWLSYFNLFREMADLPSVAEQSALTFGSRHHSQYMVVNDNPIAHSEDVNNPLYDEAGDKAAENGNIFATSQTEANYVWGVNFWISAPFHLVPMLHPGLKTAGYGDYVEEIGDVNMAAVMDIRSDRENAPGGTEYPIYFPKEGSETWVVRHSLYEWPDPIGSCPGFSRPAGNPIVLQLGDGSITPNVSSSAMTMDGQPIDVCEFDETNYRNLDSYAQEVGRTILDNQDAIVILPKFPLPVDRTYTVQIVANGETYTWNFRTRKGPPE